jgi:hypothetical protein
MGLMENLVQGFARAAGADKSADDIQAQKDRRQGWSDERRKAAIGEFMGYANNMHKQLALLLNPDTMQPMPGKEQQAAQIRQQLGQVDDFIKKLYNPNFNPDSGMAGENPLHKLGDKLHLTKSPAGSKTAGQQMKDLKSITERYGEEPVLLSGDDQKKAARIAAGLDPRAKEPKPAKPVLKLFKLRDGSIAYLNAGDADSIPEGAQPVVGSGAPKKSQYSEQKAEFAQSLGKKPEELTWPEEQQFLKQRQPFGDERLQIALSNLRIADTNLKLKQSEGDFRSFMVLQKQLSPLEKIQVAASNAREYVANPSGPGDVGLVFSFIEATKPSSGFRFTDAERKWIIATRGIVEGAETRINQGFTGETLSPEQRATMASIIEHVGQQVREQTNALLGGAAQFKPNAAKAASDQVSQKKKHSLKKAMALPMNKDKSAADVRDDLKKHGYEVIEDAEGK